MTREGFRSARGAVCALFLFAAAVWPAPLRPQPMTERSPNVPGTWTTPAHALHFGLSHRFEMAGSDVDVSDLFGEEGKVVNYPTFSFTYGLFDRAHLGVQYSSNAVLVGQSNEWQPFLAATPVRELAGGRLSAGATGAWNAAAESFDGELTVQADLGRLRLIGAGRAFSNPFDRPPEEEEAEIALAGAAVLKLNRFVSLSADYANMVSQDDAQIAWSAGAAIRIPATPHTLALYATNVTSGTLQGRSVGLDDTTYWGFEFTIPFNAGRWSQIFDPPATPARSPAADTGAPPQAVDPAAPVVEIEISNISFGADEIEIEPGTTVRWVNLDPVEHTSTSDDGLWDSGLIPPEGTFERTFDEPGRFDFYCIPHPFMNGTIVVRESP
ncbi:MAG: cupredoxin family copper-binding protein [Gemmatimonadota bacterium]|nr:cupredoxin family copper-binding protein [Gemmatimonadota bacterium]